MRKARSVLRVLVHLHCCQPNWLPSHLSCCSLPLPRAPAALRAPGGSCSSSAGRSPCAWSSCALGFCPAGSASPGPPSARSTCSTRRHPGHCRPRLPGLGPGRPDRQHRLQSLGGRPRRHFLPAARTRTLQGPAPATRPAPAGVAGA